MKEGFILRKRILFRLFVPAQLTFSLLFASVPILGATTEIGFITMIPWSHLDKDQKHIGVHVDIFKSLFAELGQDYRAISLPYQRLLIMLKQGKVDLAPLAWSDKINDVAVRGSRICTLDFGVLAPSEIKIPDIQSLKKLHIVGLRGVNENQLLGLDSSSVKHEVGTYKQALNMVILGRIDAIAGSIQTIKGSLRKKK